MQKPKLEKTDRQTDREEQNNIGGALDVDETRTTTHKICSCAKCRDLAGKPPMARGRGA